MFNFYLRNRKNLSPIGMGVTTISMVICAWAVVHMSGPLNWVQVVALIFSGYVSILAFCLDYSFIFRGINVRDCLERVISLGREFLECVVCELRKFRGFVFSWLTRFLGCLVCSTTRPLRSLTPRKKLDFNFLPAVFDRRCGLAPSFLDHFNS